MQRTNRKFRGLRELYVMLVVVIVINFLSEINLTRSSQTPTNTDSASISSVVCHSGFLVGQNSDHGLVSIRNRTDR